MKTQNKDNQKKTDINPVSRKTNEEIDEDENGNLIIGGRISIDDLSGKHYSEDKPRRKNNLANIDQARED